MGDAGGHDTFASDWLALREPADHRARSAELVGRLATAGAARGWTRVLDLGSGRGSNLRYLQPRLGWADTWTAVDHDGGLLAELVDGFAGRVHPVEGDLRREGLDAIGGSDVVTASALLDLVTSEWVAELAERSAAAECAVLLALTWDGSVVWEDPDPVDALVLEAVRRHQTGEKGMGTALGPGAAAATTAALRGVGFDVSVEPSPWRLSGEADARLATVLVDGWVEAAVEVRADRRNEIAAWRDRRMASIRGGAWAVRVGHHDLLALPPGDGA
jgi:SAM-dependent methyltransferase